MRRKLSVIGLVMGLAMIVAVIASSRRQTTVTIISPPAGVTVPAGQAVEVRYRVTGANAHTELWCDGARLATEAAQAGQELAHAWIPANRGMVCCIVQARDERNATLASARRCLTVGAEDSPVRLDGP